MISIIGGRAKIIDMRKKSSIYVDQGNFNNTVRNIPTESRCVISERNKFSFLNKHSVLLSLFSKDSFLLSDIVTFWTF
jgi:hypothetical protein